MARERVVGDGQCRGLQAFQFVAQAGGGFEFQVGGGGAHLLFDVGDDGLDVVADKAAPVFGRGQLAAIHGDMVAFVHAAHDVVDLGLDAGGRDAVFLVVGFLLGAAAAGFGHGAFHAAGDAVGIQDHLAVHVARGAADGLHQAGLAAQEAFLVGVQDGDQSAFGNVQAFAQQVDADQHVEGAQAQVADDLDALQRFHVRVHIAYANALFVHVFGEVFGHLLGQGGDQRAIARLGNQVAFGDQVVDL